MRRPEGEKACMRSTTPADETDLIAQAPLFLTGGYGGCAPERSAPTLRAAPWQLPAMRGIKRFQAVTSAKRYQSRFHTVQTLICWIHVPHPGARARARSGSA